MMERIVEKRSKDIEGQKRNSKRMKKMSSKPVLGVSVLDKDDEEVELEKLVFGGSDLLVAQLDAEQTEVTKIKDEAEGVLDRLERKPVWEDDDEEEYYGESNIDTLVTLGQKSEKSQERRLRSHFERVIGTKPTWAKLKSEREEESGDESSDSDDNEEGQLPLKRRAGSYITTSANLPKTTLNIQRVKDANIKQRTKRKVTALEFHKSAQVILVAGFDQTLNLFQVDGENNAKIQTIFFENFPIHSAHFSASGTEVIVTSDLKSFHCFDMMTGKVSVIPNIKGVLERSFTRFKVSPDGKVLAFRGKAGNIHIISATSKEFICTMKMNGEARDFDFSSDGSRLFSIGDECSVYVWDMKSRRCIHRFDDDGCMCGNTISTSTNGQFLATGSSSGVVNIYDEQCLTQTLPKPLRIVKNLTTPITCTKFGPRNEMLGISSAHLSNAAKLVHLPSCHTFSNFGDMHYQYMRCPTVMDFSPNNGYLCVGNSKGHALLYRLKHYDSY